MRVRLQLERYVPPVSLPRCTFRLSLAVAFALGASVATWLLTLILR